jgi:hypothetical protein
MSKAEKTAGDAAESGKHCEAQSERFTPLRFCDRRPPAEEADSELTLTPLIPVSRLQS